MKIGELAKKTGMSVQAIRYYEKEGLLKSPSRSDGNFRLYGQESVQQLEFIKHCRAMDISLAEIRQMLNLNRFPESGCDSVNAMIDAHIESVNIRIKELKSLKKSLTSLRQQCQAENAIKDCGILKALNRPT